MKNLRLLLTLLLLSLLHEGFSQPALQKMKAKLNGLNSTTANLEVNLVSESQAGILFSPASTLTSDQTLQWLSNQLELRQGVDQLLPESVSINTGEVTMDKLHQYYKGIKVEHGVINTTSRGGKIAMMQMEYYSIDDQFKTSPVLNERAALQKAIDFTAASIYKWTNYTGADPDYMEPRGELVIVATYKKPGEVCLAYKFDIYSLQPVGRAHVYVNAWDGTIVLNNPIIKHTNKKAENGDQGYGGESDLIIDKDSREKKFPLLQNRIPAPLVRSNLFTGPNSNTNGTADTRFLGQQAIITDNNSGVAGKPFRLRQARNGQNIITLNYNKKAYNTNVNNEVLATEFTDNDNNWTSAEYDNGNWDNAALDVHFNMQIVSDYWTNVHNRAGWDDKAGQILSYVHVEEAKWDANKVFLGNYFLPNAFWDGSNMHFGDGTGNFTKTDPYNTLDICAHELGHAITQTTCNLVYQWESGAMNEAFSDIWAACITNYAKVHYASLPGEVTWRIAEKCYNLDKTDKGFRDMSNPGMFSHPGTYKNLFWKEASIRTCRDFANTDNCGVHDNSGVLNKWFFLITDGESSFNSFGYVYNITGLGFGISQKIAYLTSINLTPNASYATAKSVSIDAAATLYGANSVEVQTVKEAWKAVGVGYNTHNMSNTPIFAVNNFTSVGVDANGDVWAGTNYNGLYCYTAGAWEKRSEIPNVRINDIKADKTGNIWIAQSGTQAGGTQATAGGVNYFRSPFGPTDNSFYTVGAQANIPSRNARCIYVDTNLLTDVVNPTVWVATLAYITSGNSASGMLGQGLYANTKYFHNVSGGLNIGSNTAGVLTVGGIKNEVWTFAQANNGINQLLRYNANNNSLITYYDHNTDPILPSGFIARSIYGDGRGRVWFALANNGVVVLDENQHFHYINFPAAFPAGTQASFNAICGNRLGDVYIGTNNGIVFFDHGDGLISKLDDPNQYKLFSKTNGLPSNQVNALAYDTSRFNLLVASDSGVTFFEPFCIGFGCKEFTTNVVIATQSLSSGNWSNPAIWSNNKVPDSLTNVTMSHAVAVDVNGRCKTLTIVSPGSVTVNTGFNLTLYQDKQPIILGSQKMSGIIKKKK